MSMGVQWSSKCTLGKIQGSSSNIRQINSSKHCKTHNHKHALDKEKTSQSKTNPSCKMSVRSHNVHNELIPLVHSGHDLKEFLQPAMNIDEKRDGRVRMTRRFGSSMYHISVATKEKLLANSISFRSHVEGLGYSKSIPHLLDHYAKCLSMEMNSSLVLVFLHDKSSSEFVNYSPIVLNPDKYPYYLNNYSCVNEPFRFYPESRFSSKQGFLSHILRTSSTASWNKFQFSEKLTSHSVSYTQKHLTKRELTDARSNNKNNQCLNEKEAYLIKQNSLSDDISSTRCFINFLQAQLEIYYRRKRLYKNKNNMSLLALKPKWRYRPERKNSMFGPSCHYYLQKVSLYDKKRKNSKLYHQKNILNKNISKIRLTSENISGSGYTSDGSCSVSSMTFNKKKKCAIRKAFWEVMSEKKTEVQPQKRFYKNRQQSYSCYNKKLTPFDLPLGFSNDSVISNLSSDTLESSFYCDKSAQKDINENKNIKTIDLVHKSSSADIEKRLVDSLYNASDLVTEKSHFTIEKKEQGINPALYCTFTNEASRKEKKNHAENKYSTVGTKPKSLKFSGLLQALGPSKKYELEHKTNNLTKYPINSSVYSDEEIRRYSSQTVTGCTTGKSLLVSLTKSKKFLTPRRHIKNTHDPNMALQLNDKKEWSQYFVALMRKQKNSTIRFPSITVFSRVLYHIKQSKKCVPVAIICVAKPFFINPNSKTSIISKFLLNCIADATQSWMYNILQVDSMRRMFMQQKYILRLHRNVMTNGADTRTSVMLLLSFMKKLTNASDAALFIVDRATKQFVCCESNERKCIGLHLKFTDKILGSCYFHKVPQRFISFSIVQTLDPVNMTNSDVKNSRFPYKNSCHSIPKLKRASKTLPNLNLDDSKKVAYTKLVGFPQAHFGDDGLGNISILKPKFVNIARSATGYDFLKKESFSHCETLHADNSLSNSISLLKFLGSINLSYDLVSQSTVTRSVICLPVLNYNQDVMAIILVMNKYHKSYRSNEKEEGPCRFFSSRISSPQDEYSEEYKKSMWYTQPTQLQEAKGLFDSASLDNRINTQEEESPRRHSAPLQKKISAVNVYDKESRDDTKHTLFDKKSSITDLSNTKTTDFLSSENAYEENTKNASKNDILLLPSRLQNLRILGLTDSIENTVLTEKLSQRLYPQHYHSLKYVIPFSHEDINILTTLVSEIARLHSNEFQYTYLDILRPFPSSGHVQYFGAVPTSLVSPKNVDPSITKNKSISKNSTNEVFYPSVSLILVSYFSFFFLRKFWKKHTKTIKEEPRLTFGSLSRNIIDIFSTTSPTKICVRKRSKTSKPVYQHYNPIGMLQSNTSTNKKTTKTELTRKNLEKTSSKKKTSEVKIKTIQNLLLARKMQYWMTHPIVSLIIQRFKKTSGHRFRPKFTTIFRLQQNNFLRNDLWNNAQQRISYTSCMHLSLMIQKQKYYNNLFSQKLLKKKVLYFKGFKNFSGNVGWKQKKLFCLNKKNELANGCFKATCLVLCKPRHVPSLSNVQVIFRRRLRKKRNRLLFENNSTHGCKTGFQDCNELIPPFNKNIKKRIFFNKYCFNLLKLHRKFNSSNKRKRLKDIVMNCGIGWWDYSCVEIMNFFIDSLRSLNLDALFISDAYPKLELFFHAISRSYHADNPYHNFFHAIQVYHIVWLLLYRYNCSKYLNAVDILATLLGALCHDVDHPGFNNEYLIATSHTTALIYNDISVLENHHCSFSFRLLERYPELDFRFSLDEKDRQTFRNTFIQGILATDMRCHTSKLQQMSNRIQRHYSGTELLSPNNEDDRRMVTEMVLHAADISNPLIPPPYHRRWASLIVEEFNLQCDQEMYIGLSPTPFMNCRTEKSRIDCQIEFLNFIVIPLWKTVALLLPSLENFVRQGELNVSKWQRYSRNLQLAEESQEREIPVKSKFNFSYSDIRHRHP